MSDIHQKIELAKNISSNKHHEKFVSNGRCILNTACTAHLNKIRGVMNHTP